jgi:two-component system NarL family sensor kinase
VPSPSPVIPVADGTTEVPEGADPLEEVGAGDLAQALTKALERRLARLSFDIHDGPLQKLALLSSELALLRRQLAALAPDAGMRRIAERRVDDLAALVDAVSHELRSLITSRSSSSSKAPLRQLLVRQIDCFRSVAGIKVELELGDLRPKTDSQRLACVQIVEEALANVRRHSGAASVRVSVLQAADAIVIGITDDGRGFDVADATRRAARNGRLGLATLSERARLLGGRLEIRSRPGGPTVVRATLPVWEPPHAGGPKPGLRAARVSA